jgi:lipopolysaccharide export system protein LptC
MSWRMVLGLVLLIAAALSGWSAWKQRDVPEVDTPSTERADYLMRDFEMISLDNQGQESMTLRAPEMQRSPKDETFQITTPLFLLPDTDGKHWEMRSKTAWVSAKGDEVRLSGQVNGHSPQGTAVPTTFETERLNVFPRKNLASTEAAVTITRPGSILSGVGFETNTKTKQYTFKSQVKARYEPNSAR